MSADVSHCLAKSLGDRLIALLVRPVPTERQRLLALTIISGGVCGLAAVAFHVSIVKMTALLIGRAETAPRPWWIYLTILTPTLGGVVAGLGIRYWAPGAVGSGIPQVKLAYAREAGRVSIRDAFGKFVLKALQIGSGASLGR